MQWTRARKSWWQSVSNRMSFPRPTLIPSRVNQILNAIPDELPIRQLPVVAQQLAKNGCDVTFGVLGVTFSLMRQEQNLKKLQTLRWLIWRILKKSEKYWK